MRRDADEEGRRVDPEVGHHVVGAPRRPAVGRLVDEQLLRAPVLPRGVDRAVRSDRGVDPDGCTRVVDRGALGPIAEPVP